MDDSFRKTVLNGIAYTLKLPIPENGVDSKRPTKEELEANALEFGGAQGRKPKAKAKLKAAKRNSKAKPLFRSKTVNESTPGHSVEIDVAIPKGSKQLHLAVFDVDGFAFDWADWCEPRLVMVDGTEKKLTELKWTSASVGWGEARVNQNAGGGALRVAGEPVAYGIGVHASSLLSYKLPDGVRRFKARGGIDNGGSDQGGESSVQFAVYTQNPGTIGSSNSSSGGGGATTRDPAAATEALTVHDELDVSSSSPASRCCSARAPSMSTTVVACGSARWSTTAGTKASALRVTASSSSKTATAMHQRTRPPCSIRAPISIPPMASACSASASSSPQAMMFSRSTTATGTALPTREARS